MTKSQLSNKKIAILGLGIENQALINFLVKHKVRSEITVCDARSEKQLDKKYLDIIQKSKNLKTLKINWKLGDKFNNDLDEFDILFRSPGWPLFCPGLKKTKGKRCNIYSAMKLFFDLCPTKNIIGVTGTKGKGTTSSLITKILKQSGKKVWLGGNIGVAPFDFIDKINKSDWVVLELSSFQLEDLHKSPRIAVITNFYKEHLAPADPLNPNYHKSLANYWSSKNNIYKHQKLRDKLIINHQLIKRMFKSNFRRGANLFTFKDYDDSADSFFIDNSHLHLLGTNFGLSTTLPGNHNKENIAAAVLASRFANIAIADMQKAVEKFNGLEHRIEKVASTSGITYYNDSFSTTPESAMTAIKSFEGPITLLAGGAEKKSDFRQLAKLIKEKVSFVVLLAGDATKRLESELTKNRYPRSCMKIAHSIKDAVQFASKNTAYGGVVLLSPACASFGMFKNYKERGLLFKYEVIKISIAHNNQKKDNS
jgi:UDP-N-acetylmuramoylalanine--D-glutamate ligase